MRIHIRHRLSVVPPAGVAHSVMQTLLTARSGPGQEVRQWQLEVPGMDEAARFTDGFGNIVHLVNQHRPEGKLVISVQGVVETHDTHGVLGRVEGEPVPALFRRVTPLTQGREDLADELRGSTGNRLDLLHQLMARVNQSFLPESGVRQEQVQHGQAQMQSNGEAVAGAEAMEVPEDLLPKPPASAFAHAFIGVARALDIPARYVTGYLEGADDGVPPFHAWAEAWDDRLGWIGFDPMLVVCPTESYVRLAVGLDALATLPLRVVPAGDGVREVETVVTQAGG